MKQDQITISNCPVCESAELEIYLETKDYFLTQEDFSISRCSSCGFLFTNPRPINDHLPQYYESEEYISHSNAKHDLTSKLYQRVRKHTLNRKSTLIQKYFNTGKVLDIGCGTGEFLNELSKKGFDVTGIEPNKEARKYGIENYHLNVYDEEEIQLIKHHHFEIITMWHVLEHVPGLKERVIQVKRLLATNGLLVVAVPNPLAYDAKYYGKFWAAYDLPRHLYHFRKKDIRLLFENGGFQIIKILPMYFDSFYVSLLSEKYKTGSKNLFRAFLTGLISNFQGKMLTGNYSSQIYLLRHKNV